MSKGYSALPQDGNYAQPTGYAGGEQPPQYPGYAGENQPLHQPVNNSFGTQQQDFYQQQYQQPHVQQQPPGPGYGATGYHQRPQPAFNPHYNPAPPAPVMQQQSSTVSKVYSMFSECRDMCVYRAREVHVRCTCRKEITSGKAHVVATCMCVQRCSRCRKEITSGKAAHMPWMHVPTIVATF